LFSGLHYPSQLNINGDIYLIVSDAAGIPVKNEYGNALYAREKGN